MRGHAEALGLVRHALAQERIASTYLFVGPQGVGKERVARALAQALNCESPQGTGEDRDACGQCRHCRLIATNRFADLFVVQRLLKDDERSEANLQRWREARLEDLDEALLKQEITVEAIDDLMPRLAYRPNEGGSRWVLLREAERMHPAVANKLLKVLEEPPPDTHFVLLTHRPNALLPTIRSRCRVLRFGVLDDIVVRAVLGELGVPDEVADRVAALGDGSVGRALSFINGEDFARRQGFVEALLEALRERSSPVGTFAELGEQAKAMDRGDLAASLILLLRHVRGEAVAHAHDARLGAVNAARADVVREALETVDGGGSQNLQAVVQSMLARLRETRA